MNVPVRSTSISRRRMLRALSLGSAGAALAGHLPAYAMQAGRTTAAPPALLPLNRFPRMVQEFFVRRENEIHEQRVKRARFLVDEGRRRRLCQDGPWKSPRVVRSVSRKDAAQCPRDEGRGARHIQDRERPLRKPAGISGVGEPLHSERSKLPSSGCCGVLRAFRQRQGHRDLSILLPGTGTPGLCRADLRSDRPGRADAVPRRAA